MFCCMIGFHMNLISQKICNTQLCIVRKGVLKMKLLRIAWLSYTYNLQLRIHISLDGITEQNQQTFFAYFSWKFVSWSINKGFAFNQSNSLCIRLKTIWPWKTKQKRCSLRKSFTSIDTFERFKTGQIYFTCSRRFA